ncbi:MAG TPA: dATP/dGTP pyrophosphohydrolase domain-containing protein [Verrucomicrobiae bacterium]|nr:dATP/dGTP pyrophosphohydrolase domain-containing protein [Verrucomicrobiae bacterium]
MTTLQQLQDEQSAWADRTFPGETIESVIDHLIEEARELRNAPHDLVEMADVLLLVLRTARLGGFNTNDLVKAARLKLDVCKTRQWENIDGNWRHVKGAI